MKKKIKKIKKALNNYTGYYTISWYHIPFIWKINEKKEKIYISDGQKERSISINKMLDNCKTLTPDEIKNYFIMKWINK